MHTYKGEYTFNKNVVSDWRSTATGVYYLFEKTLIVYVGSAIGIDGIRGRLLQHINDRNFTNVSAFGYKEINGKDTILSHELLEIKRLQPSYNVIGKQYEARNPTRFI